MNSKAQPIIELKKRLSETIILLDQQQFLIKELIRENEKLVKMLYGCLIFCIIMTLLIMVGLWTLL